VYRVEHLTSEGKPIEGMEECFIEGELDGWLVVSVPETTSLRTSQRMKDVLQLKMRKPVMIITHNTAFMKAIRLKPNEAAKVIKHGEDHAEAYADAVATYGATPEELGLLPDVGGDGSGSGDGFNGGGDSAEVAKSEADMSGYERSSDEEGGEEGPAGPEGDS